MIDFLFTLKLIVIFILTSVINAIF